MGRSIFMSYDPEFYYQELGMEKDVLELEIKDCEKLIDKHKKRIKKINKKMKELENEI
jgi:chaperonin cofactor prefoldin